MRTATEIFKEVLDELGFAGYKPDQMTNSDYWLCTCTAMERYAGQFKNSANPDFSGSLPKAQFAIEAMKSLIRSGNMSINKDDRAERLAELSWQIADEMFKRQ